MTVNFIGDTHLGRQFITNVPPHRRGDREKLIWDKFVAKLNEPCDVSIHVGDLFDKAIVPYGIIVQTADAYIKAALDRPETTFLVTRGNHDASREAGVVTAYALFQRLVRHVSNILTTGDAPVVWRNIVIVPWHPTKSPEAMLAGFDGPFDLVVGHWDKRLLPLDALSKITTHVVSGHEHKPCTYGMVEFVGSIMPMAYGEDADGADDPLYVDVGLEDINADNSYNKCLRLHLKPGEDPPPDLDCLQLVIVREAENEAQKMEEVKLEEFDLRQLFDQSMTTAEVSDETQKLIWSKIDAA